MVGILLRCVVWALGLRTCRPVQFEQLIELDSLIVYRPFVIRRAVECANGERSHGAGLDPRLCSDTMARGSRLREAVCRVSDGSRSRLRAVWPVSNWF